MARIPYVRSLFRASGSAVVRFKDGFALGMPNVAVLPTASLANRGSILRVEGASGIGDTLYLCTKTAADQYQWIPFFGSATGSTFFYEDHFIGGTKSMLGWESSGAGNTITGTGGNDRPGVLALSSGGSSGDTQRMYLADAVARSTIVVDDEWDMTFVVGPVETTAVVVRVGLANDWSANPPTSWCGFEYDSATDSTWHAITRSASTETDTNTLVTFAGTWFRLRMRRDNTGTDTVYFSVDGATEIAHTTNLGTYGCSPGLYVRTTSGAAKSLWIDYFSLFMPGLAA